MMNTLTAVKALVAGHREVKQWGVFAVAEELENTITLCNTLSSTPCTYAELTPYDRLSLGVPKNAPTIYVVYVTCTAKRWNRFLKTTALSKVF